MQLVLVRHGQSQWNLENRFTGWVDVDLSPAGEEEARRAGLELLRRGLRVRRRAHVGAGAGDPDRRDRARPLPASPGSRCAGTGG